MPPVLSANARCGHPDGQQEAQGIDTEVALATCDFLAGVDALAGRRHVGGGFHALRVQHAGAGLGIAALGLSDQAAQEAVELGEDAFLLPGGEVPVDGFPRGEVVREVAPGDPGAVDIQDGVHDAAQVVFGWASDVQTLASAIGSPG
jgi:hypothetical protein